MATVPCTPTFVPCLCLLVQVGDFAGTVTLLVESQEEGYLAQVLVSVEASSAADWQEKAPECSGVGTGGPWHCESRGLTFPLLPVLLM